MPRCEMGFKKRKNQTNRAERSGLTERSRKAIRAEIYRDTKD